MNKEIDKQIEEKLTKNAEMRAKQVNNAISNLVISRSEQCAEEYVASHGFDGEVRENYKKLYKTIFEESIQL